MASAEIRVEVVADLGPQRVERRQLVLPVGATAADALRASGLAWVPTVEAAQEPGAPQELAVGCWGRLCSPHTVLRDGDRIELYRPLRADPMHARRERFQREGLRKKTKPPKRNKDRALASIPGAVPPVPEA